MRSRPVTGSSVLLGKASAVGPTRPRTAESGCGSDLLASPSACVQKVGWVHLVVRHILLAEPMVADFGRCFEGSSPDEAEALANSFRLAALSVVPSSGSSAPAVSPAVLRRPRGRRQRDGALDPG